MATNPPDISALVEQWKACKTHKQRALVEHALWDLVPPKDRIAGKRSRRLAKLLGLDTGYEIGKRNDLRNAGAVAAPLWLRVEPAENMPLSTAVVRLREARVTAIEQDLPVEEALAAGLKEYDSWDWNVQRDGTRFRKQKASYTRHKKSGGGAPENVVHLADTERGAWQAIRISLGKLASAKLRGMDPLFAQVMMDELEAELKSVLDAWQGKLSRVGSRQRRDAKEQAAIRYPDVERACEWLHMDPPERGQPPDLKYARSQRKRLLKDYHPDVPETANRDKYEAVIQAFGVLEDYAAAFPTPAKEQS